MIVVSGGVVKNDADSVTVTRPQRAHAMLQVHAVRAARTLDRAVTDGDHCGVSLPQRQHERSRLHPGPLLGHYELAALEVLAGLGKQHNELKREHVLPVQILMQAVVVAGAVLQQEGRWLPLAGSRAAVNEFGTRQAAASADRHRRRTKGAGGARSVH